MDPQLTSLGIPTGYAGWQILQTKTPAAFPQLTQDPVVTREISYFEANAPKASTAKDLLSDPRLQDFVLTAFGLTSQSGMTALLTKVLNSTPNSTTSFAAQMTDTRYTALANAFNYGGTVTPGTPATPSSAEVGITGIGAGSTFASFSGTFAGVSVSNLDLTGVTSYQGLANTLQTAFRRADGNRSDISVTLDGLGLKVTDAQGRGTATAFSFAANPGNAGAGPIATAPTSLVAGNKATAATGGPAVTSATFIQNVVQKYTEAQFEQVLGNSSNTLREAVYAKQNLPGITNWYSVIANRPLADVVQTVLGLPSSFGTLDVDKQAQILGQRMNIADFQDPAKLSKMLNQFVAQSDAQSQDPTQNAAYQVLSSVTSPTSNGIINLTLPGSTTSTTNDSMSSSSIAAALLSSAISSFGSS